MSDLLVATIIGIIEGLTEFLPVSSTGHMELVDHLLPEVVSEKTMNNFEIFIQLGAILAIAIIYRARVLRVFGLQQKGGEPLPPKGKRLTLVHVFIAIAPALLLAFLFKDFIQDQLMSTPVTVLAALVVGGVLMIYAEKKQPKVVVNDMDQLTYRQAFIIGCFQILSLWPGFSRSGSTMSGAMLNGVSYRAAADFSFFIAIPIMCVASGYTLLKEWSTLTADDLGFFAVGFVVSFVVAWAVVVVFLKFIQKLRLTHFAYYRFALAIIYGLFILK